MRVGRATSRSTSTSLAVARSAPMRPGKRARSAARPRSAPAAAARHRRSPRPFVRRQLVRRFGMAARRRAATTRRPAAPGQPARPMLGRGMAHAAMPARRKQARHGDSPLCCTTATTAPHTAASTARPIASCARGAQARGPRLQRHQHAVAQHVADQHEHADHAAAAQEHAVALAGDSGDRAGGEVRRSTPSARPSTARRR